VLGSLVPFKLALSIFHTLTVIEAVMLGVIAAIGDSTEAAIIAGAFLIIQTLITQRLTRPVKERSRKIQRIETRTITNENAINDLVSEQRNAINRLSRRVEELVEITAEAVKKIPDAPR
jgi:hypothetical protein